MLSATEVRRPTVSWVALRLTHLATADGELAVELGRPWLYDYLQFVAARARPNTMPAVACDLNVLPARAPAVPKARCRRDA